MPDKFFQEKHIPQSTTLAGYAALVDRYCVLAPVRNPACVSTGFVKGGHRLIDGWHVFEKRYRPDDDLIGHLIFSLKHEQIDLLILKRIFDSISPEGFAASLESNLTTGNNRKLWFLYEFLTGKTLPLPAVTSTLPLVAILPEEDYFTNLRPEVSHRQRVRNNLLGTMSFCPIVRRTSILASFVEGDYSSKAKALVSEVSPDLLARAASFLLLADTKASFAIEGETPPRSRIERWGRAVQQAGHHELSIVELERLQRILIEDIRFVKPGVRDGMVFVGRRDRSEDPLPEFIPAKPEDIALLLEGLLAANQLMINAKVDPVVQAAAIAFGFVYIHAFFDGNGRIHRCMIHNILARRAFNPPEMVFPVSSVIARRLSDYQKILRGFSSPVMSYIKWRPTLERNVEVLNDTVDLYRFIDFTDAAEFLYDCVAQTINLDVPLEIDYLKRYDKAMIDVMNEVEMPNNMADYFILFMQLNGWKFPKKRRQQGEFAKLTDDEIVRLETIVQKAFDGFPPEAISKV